MSLIVTLPGMFIKILIAYVENCIRERSLLFWRLTFNSVPHGSSSTFDLQQHPEHRARNILSTTSCDPKTQVPPQRFYDE